MKFKDLMACGILAVVVLLFATTGQAQLEVTTFSDRSIFDAQGSIAFNSNFDDFSSDVTPLGFPFNRGDVAYTSSAPGLSSNIIFGTTSRFNPVRNLITTNSPDNPVTGTIESVSTQYDMFGFDIGVLERQDRISIDLTSNLTTYSFPLLTVADGRQALDFLGFTTTNPDEYFTSFSLSTENGSGSSVGITDVAVGQQSVPEPSSAILLFMGTVGLIARRKRA